MGQELNHIEGVEIFPLKIIKDERGAVMHILRSDQSHSTQFGELYCSLVNAGVVKGWKRHKEITQSMSVPEGMMKIVIYDDRPNSSTKGTIKTIEFGIDDYVLVRLPPMVWYSFKAISEKHAIIVNYVSQPYDPKESEVLPLSSSHIPYSWSV